MKSVGRLKEGREAKCNTGVAVCVWEKSEIGIDQCLCTKRAGIYMHAQCMSFFFLFFYNPYRLIDGPYDFFLIFFFKFKNLFNLVVIKDIEIKI